MKITGKLTAAALAVLVMAGAAPVSEKFCLLPDMAITASALSGSGTASDPYVVTTWAELKDKMNWGGYIKLGADVTDPTKDSYSYLMTVTKSVVLDLNGHTIDRGLTSYIPNGHVIENHCANTNTLTIKDSMGGGKITGGYNQHYGGGIVNYGNLILEGGTISGNKSEGHGGGIFTTGYSTFTMTGGTISGNIARVLGGGIHAGPESTITMSGGTISGNIAKKDGGGVAIEAECTFTMTGGTISGNTSEYDTNTNGVFCRTAVGDHQAGVFKCTGGVVNDSCGGAADLAKITYNSNGGTGTMSAQYVPKGTAFALMANGFTAPAGGAFLGWSTTANGSIITSITATGDTTVYARWSKPLSGCSITIADQTYNGSAITPEPVVKDGDTTLTNGTDYNVEYSNNINAGTATVTVKGTGTYIGTLTKNFTIKPKSVSEPTVDLSAIQFTYNGTEQKPSVTVGFVGETGVTADDYTMTFSNDCMNAGAKKVTVTAKASGNYTFEAVEKPFTIAPKAVTVTANNTEKKFGAPDPVFTAKVEGLIGNDTVAYSVNCTHNNTAGTYEIIPTGNAVQGNYTVTFVKGIFTIGERSPYDITGNGSVDDEDVKQYAAQFIFGNGEYVPALDFNNDNVINGKDIIKMRQDIENSKKN